MAKKKSDYLLLKRKWLIKHKKLRKKLYQKHQEAFLWLNDKFPAKEQLASGAIGALMLSSVLSTSTVLGVIADTPSEKPVVAQIDRTAELLGELTPTLPQNMRLLNADEEVKMSQILSQYFGMDVKADIGGLRLNRTYGVIGAEQHLVRFPGDGMAGHIDMNDPNYKLLYSSGMAPGRGAWGYFAKYSADLNQDAIEREKWYIAVQTFAAPDYNGRLSDYRDFFKWRKMLVVNTETGQAVVCDIADSGPAVWTGKHLGGSPEVMQSLGFAKGPRKGDVLYFFINDASDKIPLGPIKPMGLVS